MSYLHLTMQYERVVHLCTSMVDVINDLPPKVNAAAELSKMWLFLNSKESLDAIVSPTVQTDPTPSNELELHR